MRSGREQIFVLVVVAIWTAFSAYIGFRLIASSSIRQPWRQLSWAALACVFVCSLAAFFGSRWSPRSGPLVVLLWAGYVSMGLVLVALPLVLMRDVAAMCVLVAEKLIPKRSPWVDVGRRMFLSNASSAAIAGVTVALGAVGLREARKRARVVEITVPIQGLRASLDGFRIVQLTDVHVGPTIRRSYLEAIVEKVNTLGADLVALTGDLVDGYVDELREHVAPFGELKSRYGTFYVTGNHEYYWGALDWIEEARRLGIRVLNNEHTIIEHEGGRLLVGGVTDVGAGGFHPDHRSSPERAIRGGEADFKLLLAHQPRSLHAAQKAGFDLQISGHTHGGQFFPWNLFVGLVQPVVAGLHRLESMWIYVSRGTGYWGPPLRVGAPSEITLLTLRRA